jgi:hypothetical protein
VKNTSDSSSFSIRWPTLSVALAAVALAALGTLAVTVQKNDIDILSTVALALAVLSFAAQLIVTMAQSFQSSQVNAEMKETLAAMGANTTALLTNQREQYDTVLNALLRVVPDAIQEVSASGNDDGQTDTEDSEALASRIIDKFRDELRDISPPQSRTVRSVSPAARRRVAQRLNALPERTDGEPIVRVLNGLAPGPIGQFMTFVVGVLRNGRSSGQMVYGPRNSQVPTFDYMDLLAERGLIESSPRENGGRIITLTSEGWVAAALLRPRSNLPAWAASLRHREP